MRSAWSLLCLPGFLLARPQEGAAQPGPVWPRHPTTGRVEFAGTLPWPGPTPTAEQQQALVRRWYQTKLTTQTPVNLAGRDTSYVTFAGLPNWACLDSVHYAQPAAGAVDSVYDRVVWRLGYSVRLTPTPAGLVYRLSEFEGAEIVFDASNSQELETLLPRYSARLAGFYRRLRQALAGW